MDWRHQAACLDEDPELSRLEVREAGLNEAFNALTREAA